MRANKLSARLVKLLACVIIILSTLLGCAKGNEQINTSSQQNTASASYSQAVTESQIGPPDTATVSVDESMQASAKKQATKENKEDKRESRSSASTKHFSTTKVTTSTATVQSVTSKKASTVKDTDVTAESACATTSATKQTVTEKPTTVKATTAATTETVTQSPLTEITCTVSIECAEILDNMDSLKAGHEGFIPSDGVILNTYSVTAKASATVYDLLKAACSENDIKLTEQKTLYGTYIAGINNIDEKDCGAQSGWTYTVNGKYPSKSCDKYKLSNGDKVVFKYTCS